jgi:hypothetical protein
MPVQTEGFGASICTSLRLIENMDNQIADREQLAAVYKMGGELMLQKDKAFKSVQLLDRHCAACSFSRKETKL